MKTPMDKRVSGIILAAGRSQRMGRPKALLPIFGTTFLEHIVHQVRASRLVEVKIVLGHRPEAILDRLPHLEPVTVINSRYREGQLSSLQTGIRALDPETCDGLMMFLVDHPLVDSTLIDAMLDCFSQGGHPIVIPSFQRRRGHPVLFARELFPELLAASPEEGAVAVVRQHRRRIYHLEWNSDEILIDVDTPEAYQRWIQPRTASS
ncbi:MAG: nucleotidyltransferase family protein [Acidobacteria bacterium]|nr:nucleotidyltransferase family protein [Acidobacteriota bacterium]MYC80653.1 nucleotidyltransferase family protein [Acidobacteriota bacterium]